MRDCPIFNVGAYSRFKIKKVKLSDQHREAKQNTCVVGEVVLSPNFLLTTV